jgi:phosphoribosyl-ATP pyrophosphohydrolase/phosphoribosyl-AMP cyclohydrolase
VELRVATNQPRNLFCSPAGSGGRLSPANSAGQGQSGMDFTKLDGLVPAVIQDAETNEVLMVGFMNDEALRRTRESGFATFYSRSRQKLWMKGETSGNRLEVIELLTDCDDDTVLARVKRLGDGNVCHTGERTCFFKGIDMTRQSNGA